MRKPIKSLLRTIALLLAVTWLGGAAHAYVIPVIVGNVMLALGTPGDQDSVLAYLRDYEATLATGRVERIASLYADFDARKEHQVENYFGTVVAGLSVHLDDIQIVVEGDTARVDFERTDRFTDRVSGEKQRKAVSISRELERHGASWRMRLDGQS